MIGKPQFDHKNPRFFVPRSYNVSDASLLYGALAGQAEGNGGLRATLIALLGCSGAAGSGLGQARLSEMGREQ
jgi:hypothetical protein